MTMKEAWEKINEEQVAHFICYLWSRWLDEREYEDIRDYLTAVQKFLPSAFKITKRPFGFSVKCSDGVLKLTVKGKGNQLVFNGEYFEEDAA